MNTSASPADTLVPPEIRALLDQRDQLRTWLDRLRTVDDGTPARITERVRADYTHRLEVLTGELSRHAEALDAELEQLRAQLERAENSAAQAADALAEARLRHQIGELPPAVWEERSATLEGAAARAHAEADAARDSVGRLAELVGEIGMGAASAAPAAPNPFAAPAPPFEDERTQPLPAWAAVDDVDEQNVENDADAGVLDDLPFLSVGSDDETTHETPAAPEEDLAFLEELDRAIAASMGSDVAETSANGDASAVGRPIACRECGSGNDAQAWYCEICGSEL